MSKHPYFALIQQFFIFTVLIVALLFIQGCGAVHVVPSKQGPDFATVIVRPGDTLSGLAAKYLQDPGKSWIIAEFNDISKVTVGQELVIPLKPFSKANLSQNGYQSVPVLAYHDFSETKQNMMTVRKQDFELQMEFLKNNGYSVITLDNLFDFLDYKNQIPRKSVVITIDDGWRGVYEIAYPILKKYGFPATLFVYTDLITGNKHTLSWAQIAEMSKGGLDIQCHSKTHRNFNEMMENESLQEVVSDIEKETRESARIIKSKINKDVKYFAYPYGESNNLAIAFLMKNGYRGAFTVKRKSNPFFSNHYKLHRDMIYGDFNLKDFKKNLQIYSNEAMR